MKHEVALRIANSRDVAGIARLLERCFFTYDLPRTFWKRKQLRSRIRSAYLQTRKTNGFYSIAVVDGTVRACSFFQECTNRRVYSYNMAVDEVGTKVSKRLISSVAAEYIRFCQRRGWPDLHLFANFENPVAEKVASYLFTKEGFPTKRVVLPQKALERLRFGKYMHGLGISIEEIEEADG